MSVVFKMLPMVLVQGTNSAECLFCIDPAASERALGRTHLVTPCKLSMAVGFFWPQRVVLGSLWRRTTFVGFCLITSWNLYFEVLLLFVMECAPGKAVRTP